MTAAEKDQEDHVQGPSEESVRSAVRRHYSELAKRESPCCGQTSQETCGCGGIYPSGKIISVPSEAKDVSAGCGDPVTIAELSPGMTIVDLGSGGGIDVFMAADAVGADGRAIGIDATPEMVHRARETARRHGIANVEFRLGEIEHIPLEDGCTDVVISNCVINLSPDKEQVFREAFRILKKGGKLAVSDMVLLRPMPEGLRGDLIAWATCIGGAIQEQEYIELMQKVGFVDAKVEDRVVLTDEQLRSMLTSSGSPWVGSEKLSDLIASSRFSGRKSDE